MLITKVVDAIAGKRGKVVGVRDKIHSDAINMMHLSPFYQIHARKIFFYFEMKIKLNKEIIS